MDAGRSAGHGLHQPVNFPMIRLPSHPIDTEPLQKPSNGGMATDPPPQQGLAVPREQRGPFSLVAPWGPDVIRVINDRTSWSQPFGPEEMISVSTRTSVRCVLPSPLFKTENLGAVENINQAPSSCKLLRDRPASSG